MEGKSPVVTGAQRELIEKYAALVGEDGKAIVQDIEGEAERPGKLPADVFRLIDSCLHSLGQRAKRQELSNEVIKRQEPVRLMQVEVIREHATRIAGARASGDNAALESTTQAMLGLVEKFMADVDMDMVDGLDPDTTRAWREQVYEIAGGARPDQPSGGGAGAGVGPPVPTEAPDHLAPLKSAIKLATHTMEAVAREIQDPDEITLRGFAKHLGNSKKEIMTLSRSLVVGQSASMATEATRLADEASETIKASRESIRAALRGLGAASDISEASGPTKAQWPLPTRPVMGNMDPEWAIGAQPAASGWAQQPPPTRSAVGNMDPE
jgi:hypothetical protein